MIDNILKVIEIAMGYIIVLALLVAFILTAPVLAGTLIVCGMIMMVADSIRSTREARRKVEEAEKKILNNK